MAKKEPPEVLAIDGREVVITSPGRVYFPKLGVTKLDLVRYYLAVSEGALRGVYNRPIVLKRYVRGIDHDFFFQKRAPEGRPDWVETTELRYPSGRSADELVVTERAQLAWMVNLGNIDLNPHPVRADDLEHPDELRVDLDPTPGASWEQVRKVALCAREVLEEHGLTGWPKTSGSRGIHVLVRVERRFTFTEVRRAALALAREVARRLPDDATASWWKEERHGVFIDYNQNAKDRTVCSAYSVRPRHEAWVSAPVTWDEVPTCELGDFTMASVLARMEERGDLNAGIDEAAGSLDALLALSARHEAEGLGGDAPWPPHYEKQPGEPDRVQPSRKQKTKTKKKVSDKKGRVSKMPLVTVSQAKTKEEALAGLERWKERHPAVTALLGVDDVLLDPMRGRSSMWYRVRVNLRNVPTEVRPAEEPPDPDYNPRRRP